MEQIRTFEDLTVWQESRKLTKYIYEKFSDSRDYWLKDQIQRASVSIMNNLAEWFERTTIPEKVQFYRYAKWSAGEVRSMLYLCLDIWFVEKNIFDDLLVQVTYISQGISKMMTSLEKYK